MDRIAYPERIMPLIPMSPYWILPTFALLLRQPILGFSDWWSIFRSVFGASFYPHHIVDNGLLGFFWITDIPLLPTTLLVECYKDSQKWLVYVRRGCVLFHRSFQTKYIMIFKFIRIFQTASFYFSDGLILEIGSRRNFPIYLRNRSTLWKVQAESSMLPMLCQ